MFCFAASLHWWASGLGVSSVPQLSLYLIQQWSYPTVIFIIIQLSTSLCHFLDCFLLFRTHTSPFLLSQRFINYKEKSILSHSVIQHMLFFQKSSRPKWDNFYWWRIFGITQCVCVYMYIYIYKYISFLLLIVLASALSNFVVRFHMYFTYAGICRHTTSYISFISLISNRDKALCVPCYIASFQSSELLGFLLYADISHQRGKPTPGHTVPVTATLRHV